MPTEQPASAPDAIGSDARDDATVAAVLHDTDLDKTPGGGGLGGAAASGAPHADAAGGTTPNSPIDTRTPGTGGIEAAGEARLRAAGDDAPEPHPASQ